MRQSKSLFNYLHIAIFYIYLIGYIGQFLDGHPVPQPDNAEYLLNKSPVTQEACVSVNNNWYSDGITWHDTVKMALFLFIKDGKLQQIYLFS